LIIQVRNDWSFLGIKFLFIIFCFFNLVIDKFYLVIDKFPAGISGNVSGTCAESFGTCAEGLGTDAETPPEHTGRLWINPAALAGKPSAPSVCTGNKVGISDPLDVAQE
jgi:hypothetical protein